MAWCINAVRNFEFQPTNLLVSLLNDQHVPVQSWYVVNAIPKSVEFSSLNAEQSQVAIETLVLSYRSEEHTSELQSLMRISYAVFCLKKKKDIKNIHIHT